MIYLFFFFIVLSLGGIFFLVFNKLTLRELTLDKIRNIFGKKVSRESVKDGEIFSMETPARRSLIKRHRLESDLGAGGEEYWIGLIKSDSGNPTYYKRLGEWYMYNNNKDYAIKTLEYAVKLDPGDKKIRKYLGGLKS